MRIWRAVRGEGSELGILARTQSTPLQIRTGIVVSAEKGWRRDAGKLPMNRGKSAVYIYTPLILLTGLITDCSPLVLIRLIIWTCSSRTLLIKHHFTSSHLHIINRIKFMRIWRAVRGEGSELGILARTQSTPKKQLSKGQPPDE